MCSPLECADRPSLLQSQQASPRRAAAPWLLLAMPNETFVRISSHQRLGNRGKWEWKMLMIELLFQLPSCQVTKNTLRLANTTRIVGFPPSDFRFLGRNLHPCHQPRMTTSSSDKGQPNHAKPDLSAQAREMEAGSFTSPPDSRVWRRPPGDRGVSGHLVDQVVPVLYNCDQPPRRELVTAPSPMVRVSAEYWLAMAACSSGTNGLA
ncbi:hypothetical protein N658DRAFT_94428 [Parathielavia hyrcaniae]|uniref:Uncharacterized protein n=1 Tax=Parathielavia hyrcaniae TaxID=113614 RepID=A0AAN6PZC3_9PEZI|nr:hypothetical protein N658DRAFT_94428 [Parathielavia hyrcaniae]